MVEFGSKSLQSSSVNTPSQSPSSERVKESASESSQSSSVNAPSQSASSAMAVDVSSLSSQSSTVKIPSQSASSAIKLLASDAPQYILKSSVFSSSSPQAINSVKTPIPKIRIYPPKIRHVWQVSSNTEHSIMDILNKSQVQLSKVIQYWTKPCVGPSLNISRDHRFSRIGCIRNC